MEDYNNYLTVEESTEYEDRPRKKRRLQLEATALYRKYHFQRIKIAYSLEENLDLYIDDHCKDELRIVVIGKTGVGKSATANTILGKELFFEDASAVAVTEKSTGYKKKINGRLVRVVDTPGLEDFNKSNEEILEQISNVMVSFSEGVHAFVFVFNLASPRFSKEDKTALEGIERRFGGQMMKHSILVYTHAECLPDGMDLETFCTRQKESNTPVSEFLEELGSNIVAVNNKSLIPAERQRNQNAILSLVDQMKKENDNMPYTSDMFKEADKLRKAAYAVLSRKKVNPKVRDTVTQIIAESPSVKPLIRSLTLKVEDKLNEELNELKEITMNNAVRTIQQKLSEIDKNLQKKRKYEEIESEQQEAMFDIKSTEGALKTSDMEKQVEAVTTNYGNILRKLQNYMKEMWKRVGLWK